MFRFWLTHLFAVFTKLAVNPARPVEVQGVLEYMQGLMEVGDLEVFLETHSTRIVKLIDTINALRHYNDLFAKMDTEAKSYFDDLAEAFDTGSDVATPLLADLLDLKSSTEVNDFFSVLRGIFTFIVERDVHCSLTRLYVSKQMFAAIDDGTNPYMYYPAAWLFQILHSVGVVKCLTAYGDVEVTPMTLNAAYNSGAFPLVNAIAGAAKIGAVGLGEEKKYTVNQLNHTRVQSVVVGFSNEPGKNVCVLLDKMRRCEGPDGPEFTITADVRSFYLKQNTNGDWLASWAPSKVSKQPKRYYKIPVASFLSDDRLSTVDAFVFVRVMTSGITNVLYAPNGEPNTLFVVEGLADYDKLFNIMSDADVNIKSAVKEAFQELDIDFDALFQQFDKYNPTAMMQSELSSSTESCGHALAVVVRLICQMYCEDFDGIYREVCDCVMCIVPSLPVS